MTFAKRVKEIVEKIPPGRTMSYKQVALLAGNEKACRAVGNILNKSSGIPCHRVVRSDKKVGGYNKGQKKKILLLLKEGVRIKEKAVLL